MENQIEKKIVILLVLVIVLFVAAGFFLLYQDSKQSQTNNAIEEKSVNTTEKTDTQVLANFPESLPMDKVLKVEQSYQASTPDGRLQSTKIFTTSLVPAEAINFYSKFFEENDWIKSVGSSISPVMMRKSELVLLLNASRPTANDTTRVEITITK